MKRIFIFSCLSVAINRFVVVEGMLPYFLFKQIRKCKYVSSLNCSSFKKIWKEFRWLNLWQPHQKRLWKCHSSMLCQKAVQIRKIYILKFTTPKSCLVPKDWNFWLSNYMTMSVPDEGNSWNTSWALNSIPTCLLRMCIYFAKFAEYKEIAVDLYILNWWQIVTFKCLIRV